MSQGSSQRSIHKQRSTLTCNTNEGRIIMMEYFFCLGPFSDMTLDKLKQKSKGHFVFCHGLLQYERDSFVIKMFLLGIEQLVRAFSIYLHSLIKANETRIAKIKNTDIGTAINHVGRFRDCDDLRVFLSTDMVSLL